MSDFLANLIRRHRAGRGGIQPRLAARFEPTAPAQWPAEPDNEVPASPAVAEAPWRERLDPPTARQAAPPPTAASHHTSTQVPSVDQLAASPAPLIHPVSTPKLTPMRKPVDPTPATLVADDEAPSRSALPVDEGTILEPEIAGRPPEAPATPPPRRRPPSSAGPSMDIRPATGEPELQESRLPPPAPRLTPPGQSPEAPGPTTPVATEATEPLAAPVTTVLTRPMPPAEKPPMAREGHVVPEPRPAEFGISGRRETSAEAAPGRDVFQPPAAEPTEEPPPRTLSVEAPLPLSVARPQVPSTAPATAPPSAAPGLAGPVVGRPAAVAASARPLPEAPPAPPEPTIEVTIGRIEVRATATAEPERPQRTEPTVMSLDDYLRQRARGGER